MPYFQNPLPETLKQSWPIDQQAVFAVEANTNGVAEMSSGNVEPYDFSSVDTFTINIAYDPELLGYMAISVNVAGVNPAVTLAEEVAALLNADPLFSDNFYAFIKNSTVGGIAAGPPYRLMIRCKKTKQMVRYYVTNAGAEEKLRFNYRAQVKELPTYFRRFTIAERFNYPDGPSLLVELDASDPVDAAVIVAAGLDPTTPKADYELLHGRSNTHTFSKITTDVSNRIVEIIEYFSGSVVGDAARKTQYVYPGVSTVASQITVVPWTLTSGDLVTPP